MPCLVSLYIPLRPKGSGPQYLTVSAAVGPYSQAIKTPHAIYCSGQLPADSRGNIIEGTMGQRTGACLKALSAVLTQAGSSLDKIVKAQIFLTDMNDFAEMNAEYEKWIKHKPARSCVAVKQLPKGVDIEIECVALP
ncbi:endoribonuclease L-PSP [Hyaloscypha sp. PMI_1271]|nr:endoribonuclease L-PSP [Hyaloscypha sp. PMI_1271]